MAKILLEKEYLTRDEFNSLMENDGVMKKEKSSNELNDGSNLDSSAKTPE
jgi:hypothetical protein